MHVVKTMIALGAWAIPVLAGTGMGAPARLTTDVANMALLRRARKATVSLKMVLVNALSGEGSVLSTGLIYESGLIFLVD